MPKLGLIVQHVLLAQSKEKNLSDEYSVLLSNNFLERGTYEHDSRKTSKLTTKIKGFLFRRRIHYINGSQALPEPLSKEKEEALLARLQSGESAVREELIVHNLRLVVYIAKNLKLPACLSKI